MAVRAMAGRAVDAPLAVLVMAGEADEEVVRLAVPFWAALPLPVYVLVDRARPWEINEDAVKRIRPAASPNMIEMEFSGNYADVFDALVCDEDLSQHTVYLILTPEHLPILWPAAGLLPGASAEPEPDHTLPATPSLVALAQAGAISLGPCAGPEAGAAGPLGSVAGAGPVVWGVDGRPWLWNRAAVIVGAARMAAVPAPPPAGERAGWVSIAQRLVQTEGWTCLPLRQEPGACAGCALNLLHVAALDHPEEPLVKGDAPDRALESRENRVRAAPEPADGKRAVDAKPADGKRAVDAEPADGKRGDDAKPADGKRGDDAEHGPDAKRADGKPEPADARREEDAEAADDARGGPSARRGLTACVLVDAASSAEAVWASLCRASGARADGSPPTLRARPAPHFAGPVPAAPEKGADTNLVALNMHTGTGAAAGASPAQPACGPQPAGAGPSPPDAPKAPTRDAASAPPAAAAAVRPPPEGLDLPGFRPTLHHQLPRGVLLAVAADASPSGGGGPGAAPVRASSRAVERILRAKPDPRGRRSAGAGAVVGIERPAEDDARFSVDEVTFVTALFDIRSKEAKTAESHHCKTVADYLRHGAQLLAWPVNLFLVVEPQFVNEIFRARDALGLRHKTFIYTMAIEQSDYAPLLPTLKALYAAGKVPAHYWAPKDTALYVWCMMQKADALRRALEANLFKSRRFYWVDFGVYHVARPPPRLDDLLCELAAVAHDRVRLTQLRVLRPGETTDAAVFYAQLQQCFAGGLFGGSHAAMRWFVAEWDREIRESVRVFPVLDQALFGRIYQRHPDRFSLVTGLRDGHGELLLPRSAAHLAERLARAVTDKEWTAADVLVSEWWPRPWSRVDKIASAQDKAERMRWLELVAAVDVALTGATHPNVGAALGRLATHPILLAPPPPAPPPSAPPVPPPPVPLAGDPSAKGQWRREAPSDGFLRETAVRFHRWGVALREGSRPAESAAAEGLAALHEWLQYEALVASPSHLNMALAFLADLALHVPVPRRVSAARGRLPRIPIWVINLERRADRWLNLRRAFAALPGERELVVSELRRVPALDGKRAEDVRYLQSLPYWPKVRGEPINAVACTSSHARLWREWASTPAADGVGEWLQVFEDDAVLAPSYFRDLSALQCLFAAPGPDGSGTAMSACYDLVWNGYHVHLPSRWQAVRYLDPPQLVWLKSHAITQGIGGMQGYLISKRGARTVLQLLDAGHNLNEEPIDVWLMRRLHDKLRQVCTVRPSVLSSFKDDGVPYEGDIAGTLPLAKAANPLPLPLSKK
jgi:GR25 family glycosyltransferase involved in LPS biosynthesis